MWSNFDELQYIIENVDNNECLGVCMDTCHLHDAGFDLTKFDDILTEFDQKIWFGTVIGCSCK